MIKMIRDCTIKNAHGSVKNHAQEGVRIVKYLTFYETVFNRGLIAHISDGGLFKSQRLIDKRVAKRLV